MPIRLETNTTVNRLPVRVEWIQFKAPQKKSLGNYIIAVFDEKLSSVEHFVNLHEHGMSI
jgi:hypothetical protein